MNAGTSSSASAASAIDAAESAITNSNNNNNNADDAHSGDGPVRWALAAAAAAEERNGSDIVVIDVGDVLGVTDLFVITHGNNARQVRAIAEGIEELLKQAGGPSPLRIEGLDDRQWVLIDYGSFVVHVFDAEHRALYQLERLWGDCPLLDWRSHETLS